VRAAAQELEAEIASTPDEPYSVRLTSKYASVPSASLFEERRQYSRRRDRDLEWVRSARLRSAGEVSLIDLSAGGVLLDATVPLRPGSVTSLEIVGRGLDAVVPLQVLRAQVSSLSADSMRFRGACEFVSPVELPDLAPLNDLPASASPDPFVGVDSALKRLVERACSADASQRLAAGDVVLVLQALSRRALTAAADPLGQHVANMLQDLMPALRHHHGLPAMLGAIERQLTLALPDTRVRLPESTPAPADARSVLISPPGTESRVVPVSIDLPANLVLDNTQARLLRTSSRLIALVQRMSPGTASTPSPEARPSESEAAPQGTAWQKVVVRYTDGQLLKGYTHDFHGSKSQFSLWPSTSAAPHERVVVPLARLKAVFFVREFGGNPDHIERKMFDEPSHGRRIEVTLLDNEVIVGTTLNYRTDSTGFFMIPADARGNNLRVFVVSSAVRQVRFP
jgi:hypothetical protein